MDKLKVLMVFSLSEKMEIAFFYLRKESFSIHFLQMIIITLIGVQLSLKTPSLHMLSI